MTLNFKTNFEMIRNSRKRPSPFTFIQSHMLSPSANNSTDIENVLDGKTVVSVCPATVLCLLSPCLSVCLPFFLASVSSVSDGSTEYVLSSCYYCLIAGQAKRPQQTNERSSCSNCLKNKSSLVRPDTPQTIPQIPPWPNRCSKIRW